MTRQSGIENIADTGPKFDNVFRCRIRHQHDGRLPLYEQLVDSITSTRQYKETQAKKVMQGLYENRFAIMAVAKTHRRKDAIVTEWKKRAVEARYMTMNNEMEMAASAPDTPPIETIAVTKQESSLE